MRNSAVPRQFNPPRERGHVSGLSALLARLTADCGDKLARQLIRVGIERPTVMELRELSAFVAVVEEGGMSAASRRLHVSQSALSQTVSALERELGVTLLERASTGVRPTEAGTTLLAEARAVLARYQQALRTMSNYSSESSGVIRLGIPLELAPDVLPTALAKYEAESPHTRVVPQHLSTAAQFAALRSDQLDVGLVRERPSGSEFDGMLVAQESLGVLISSKVAARLARSDGVQLDQLVELRWVGFPRSSSPAWYDELTGILRSHGVDTGPPAPDDQELIADVKFAAVSSGRAFALAPENGLQPLPDNVSWSPLVGKPVVRRTWVVWPAESRRRDVGRLIASFKPPGE
jgi:DNA-binding transcriptional LysR family regulator